MLVNLAIQARIEKFLDFFHVFLVLEEFLDVSHDGKIRLLIRITMLEADIARVAIFHEILLELRESRERL